MDYLDELEAISNQMENLLQLLHSGNVSDTNTKINIQNKLHKLHEEYMEKFIENAIEKEDVFHKMKLYGGVLQAEGQPLEHYIKCTKEYKEYAIKKKKEEIRKIFE